MYLARGISTFVPGLGSGFRRLQGTRSARYCYSVWLRHLAMAQERGLPTDPQVLVEFGPGSSIGTGLAALVGGAAEYLALDVVKYADVARNLAVFDELVALFHSRADIPDENEFPSVEPRLSTYRFPAHVLTAERLDRVLEARRLSSLRESVATAGEDGSCVGYRAPWHEATPNGRPADMVISQAVLEHVDELAHAYRQMYEWLRPGGFMSHVIDFRCHATARDWNGHWTYSDFTWALFRGRRPYFINRAPCSRHVALIRETGFNVVFKRRRTQPSTIGKQDLASRFRDGELTPEDLVTSGLFVQAVRPRD